MIKKETIPYVSAIIVAAGNGKRMLGISKQLHPLNSIPVVAYTVQSFLACPLIREVILVCREEEVPDMEIIAKEYIKNIPYKIVCGGSERQDSVFCGVRGASPDTEYLAIHDGVRPFVTPDEIARCIALAVKVGAATLGVKVKDTVKVVSEDGVILSTPDRSSLYAIQTPQIFEASLYHSAMNQAISEGKSYTDDCQLIENMGKSVSVCLGSYENIKITTREDIYIADAILASRKENK